MARNKEKYEFKEAKILIGKFCAYRERSHSEVKARLYDYGLSRGEVDELMFELIRLNYINEERYARAFVRGKYLHNNWGRQKIKQHLKRKDVSDQNIAIALTEIKEEEYLQKLSEILDKKRSSIRGTNTYEINYKLAKYLIQKGYESTLVWDEIRREM